MQSVMQEVDRRTRMVGENRLELLLFRLGTDQVYGINVFKVREVVTSPPLTQVPRAHSLIKGVARLRGHTLPVIDLAAALGEVRGDGYVPAFMIVTEFSSSVQGFLVSSVDSIVNRNWEQMKAPPRVLAGCAYLTAVTDVDARLVEVIDVERVLTEIKGGGPDDANAPAIAPDNQTLPILVVDDSLVARNQVAQALAQAGRRCIMARNGREALDMLKAWAGEAGARIAMVISDIEMPEMDGYTLSQQIRRDPDLAGLYILLHSSLSGGFNRMLIDKAGADRLLAKFQPDELVAAVEQHLQAHAA